MAERLGKIMLCKLTCGLKLEYVSASEVKVNPGFGVVHNGAGDFIQVQEAITADITQDLDTGSEEASQFYFLHLYRNLDTEVVGLKFSKSVDSPVLSGNCISKRIGVVRNDASSDFLKFYQFGANNDREYQWLEDRGSVLKVLDNGQAYQSFQDIDCSSLVPETAGLSHILAHETGNNVAEVRPKGETMTSYYLTSYDPDSQSYYIKPGTERKLQYKHSQTGGHLYVFVMGFKEEI